MGHNIRTRTYWTIETLMSIIRTPNSRSLCISSRLLRKLLCSPQWRQLCLLYRQSQFWTTNSWTTGEPHVFGYAVAVREGMNVICLCWTQDSKEWPEPYQRVTVELGGPGLICLHPTPDLHYRWQALVITERSPLSLEETALIGYRQGIFLPQKRV